MPTREPSGPETLYRARILAEELRRARISARVRAALEEMTVHVCTLTGVHNWGTPLTLGGAPLFANLSSGGTNGRQASKLGAHRTSCVIRSVAHAIHCRTGYGQYSRLSCLLIETNVGRAWSHAKSISLLRISRAHGARPHDILLLVEHIVGPGKSN